MSAHKRDWSRFIFGSEPIPFESPTGFVSRALIPTAVRSFQLTMRLAGLKLPFSKLNEILLKPDELHRLAYLFGTHPSRLRKLLMQDVCRVFRHPDSHREKAGRLSNSVAVIGLRRVSPLALREAKFHRLAWDRTILSFDPETLEPLMHQCPVCHSALGWRVAGEAQYCDNCFNDRGKHTTDLRDYPQEPIAVHDNQALRFFGDLALPRTQAALDRLSAQTPADLATVPHRALSEIGVTIAKIECSDWRRSEKLSLSADALARSGRALLGGRPELRRALGSLCERTDPNTVEGAIREMSGVAQEIVRQVCPDVTSRWSRQVNVVKVDPATYLNPSLRPDIQWRLEKQIRVEKLRRRVIPDPVAVEFDKMVKSSQHIFRVADVLGIEISDVEILLDRGILARQNNAVWNFGQFRERIDSNGLKSFMDQIGRGAIEATEVDLSWIQFVSIYQFKKNFPMLTWSGIMIALGESDIPRFRRHSKWPCWYYSLCVIDPHALYRQVVRAEGEEVTAQMANTNGATASGH